MNCDKVLVKLSVISRTALWTLGLVPLHESIIVAFLYDPLALVVPVLLIRQVLVQVEDSMFRTLGILEDDIAFVN